MVFSSGAVTVRPTRKRCRRPLPDSFFHFCLLLSQQLKIAEKVKMKEESCTIPACRSDTENVLKLKKLNSCIHFPHPWLVHIDSFLSTLDQLLEAKLKTKIFGILQASFKAWSASNRQTGVSELFLLILREARAGKQHIYLCIFSHSWPFLQSSFNTCWINSCYNFYLCMDVGSYSLENHLVFEPL